MDKFFAFTNQFTLLSEDSRQVMAAVLQISFLTRQPDIRGIELLEPSLINRVPLGMIASYLGITQETLSRIRSQV